MASSQPPCFSFSNPILLCQVQGCVPHPKPSPFLASRPASFERARHFVGLGSRSLPVTLTAGTEGSLWSVLRCVLIVRHSTNGLLVCGQKRKAIYLLSSPVFWQQLKGSYLRGLSRPRTGNLGAERLTPHKITGGTHGYMLTHQHQWRTLSLSLSLSIGSLPPLQASTPASLLISPSRPLLSGGRLEKQPHLVNKWHVGEVGECLVRTLQAFHKNPLYTK